MIDPMSKCRKFIFLGALLAIAGVGPRLAAQDIRVTATKPLFSNYGGRVGWGAQNNLLAFDRPSTTTGFYDIYTSNPDGSNTVCLTCGAPGLPPYSKGDPEWDSTNQYLAIQVQWASSNPSSALGAIYTPGGGVGNDLYIMDAAGKNYWQITFNAPGILHPRFSHDGKKLLWVQRTTGDYWNLMMGSYAVNNGVPQVTGIQSLPPCQDHVFCETGGWSLDDSMVFFTGTLDGQSLSGLDIYSYNLQTNTTTRLTNTPNRWDEFPFSFPNQEKIIWMSGKNVGATGQLLQTDYWVMNYDGSNKQQLTYYNYTSAPSWFTGNGLSCARMSWSPDGTQFAAHTIPNGVNVDQAGTVTIINVEPAASTLSAASFARPPLSSDSIVSSFYANLATTTDDNSSTDLPTNLGGSTVVVTDARGNQKTANLFFVSPNQVNWEMPAGLAPGPATIEFTNSNNVSVRATIDIESVGPGLFASTGYGAGPAAGYILLYHAGSLTAASSTDTSSCSGSGCNAPAVSLGSSSDSAYLVLYATGLRHAKLVTASVGGKTVPVSYAGAQPVFPGLDQVNILIPNSFAGAGMTDIYLNVDGVQTNSVQVYFQ